MPVKYTEGYNIWHLLSLSTDRFFYSKVNSSVRKIYILRPNRDQLRKMQLQGLPAGNWTRDHLDHL